MTEISPIVSAIFSRSAKEVARLAKLHPHLVNDASSDRAPLHEAALMNAYKIGGVLLDHGADPNVRDLGGWTPLHLAALGCAERFCQLMIKRGADINSYDYSDVTPLGYALASGNESAPKCAIVLRSFGAVDDLVSAIYTCNDELIASLLSERPLDERRRRQVARCIPDLLIAWWGEANRQWTPDADTAEILRQVVASHIQTLDLLIAAGAQLDLAGIIQSQSATFLALFDSSAQDILLRVLLERGANPNQRDGSGQSLLSYADLTWNPSARALLLEYGAR